MRIKRLLSAVFMLFSLTACTTTTFNQVGQHNNICTYHSSCLQGIPAKLTVKCANTKLHIVPLPVSAAKSDLHVREGDGIYELTVYGYTWAGIYFPLPVAGCPYDINFHATLYPAPLFKGAGAGYGFGLGFGACDTWLGTEPRGFEIQYSKFADQYGSLFNSTGWIPLGYPNNLTPVRLSSDTDTHAWSINVRDDKLYFTEDEGPSFGPFSLTNNNAKDKNTALLPADCAAAGSFLRVYNTTAVFSDFSANEFSS